MSRRRFTIEHTRSTGASPKAVFALLADSNRWPDWSPISEARIEEAAGPDGTGEVRTFRTGPFRSRERVITVEPPRAYGYELTSGMPINNYRSDIAIAAGGAGSTVTWHSSFEPRWPGSGRINQVVFSWFVRYMLGRLVAAAEKTP